MRHYISKVIGGLRYDTETATQICNYAKGDWGDFEYERTGLFRTKRGRYFLAGTGGPMSRWVRYLSNGQIGGEGLEPISAAEARTFAEQNADADTVEVFFDVEEA